MKKSALLIPMGKIALNTVDVTMDIVIMCLENVIVILVGLGHCKFSESIGCLHF